MTSSYAWIITKDHLGDDDRGTVGPHDANISEDATTFSQMSAELSRNYPLRNQFRMYDDDGILYYTGMLYYHEDDEESCYGPLGDFGMPNAGAVLIKYTGHPEMDCG